MWKIAGSDFEERAKFVFYLTDLNEKKSLAEVCYTLTPYLLTCIRSGLK